MHGLNLINTVMKNDKHPEAKLFGKLVFKISIKFISKPNVTDQNKHFFRF